eukprot:CAMPEP_0185771376 /NCGR_PEP_ID=MMETSP1174-20130828/64266_1 /TAXON_ID=35687 /ORGANISM="Dictyocha speculum, Strain CCMP1381" /LENGTH=69 /DNA_ID=CAMNT_0028457237 /DNA_START=114 /DNA_END=323 /DNA_ORIENTATION=+
MAGGGHHPHTTKLLFAAPLDVGPTELDLWLVADSIRGLDKRVSVPLFVQEGDTSDTSLPSPSGDDTMED